MRFDLFHSIGRVDTLNPRLNDRQVFENFFEQAQLAEDLGFSTVWVAESHFSSEVQKNHAKPVIPHYQGEVGLNADSPQLASWLFAKTKKIGFGTAIFNIVGGNGGPLGAADRVRSLIFLNSLQDDPRKLNIGVAAGRFPYINKPYGIVPRNEEESKHWSAYKRLIFVEALEIFLRLSLGETLSSRDLSQHKVDAGEGLQYDYNPRWQFEPLRLVPDLPKNQPITYVLGSSDPLAREIGFSLNDMDVFNLSFTPPEKLNVLHSQMADRCQGLGRKWHRSRMPRTVLIFIDPDKNKAEQMASDALDTYIEAMRGTVGFPAKEVLLERALIGDAQMIKEQLSPEDKHGFHADDRLMLWFEFNQTEHESIQRQMQYFSEQVMPEFL